MGDVVILAEDERWTVKKSTDEKTPLLYGVIVPPRGFISIPKELQDEIMGHEKTIEEFDNLVPVAHLGEASTKIVAPPSSIKPSDKITASPILAFGKKAITQGTILGRALEGNQDWSKNRCPQVPSIDQITWPEDDGSNKNRPCFRVPVESFDDKTREKLEKAGLVVDGEVYVGKLMIFVSVGWWEPGIEVVEGGDLNIVKNVKPKAKSEKGEFTLINTKTNEAIEKLGAFSKILAAQIQAGLVKTKELTTESFEITSENAKIAGQTLREYIEKIVNEALDKRLAKKTISPVDEENIKNRVDELEEKVASLSAEIATSPAQVENYQLPTTSYQLPATDSGKLAKLILEKYDGTPAVVLDSEGNASISGQLKAYIAKIEKFETKVATVEGKLVAKEVEAENIASLAAEVKTQKSKVKSLEEKIKEIKEKLEEVASSKKQVASSEANSTIAKKTSEIDTLDQQPTTNYQLPATKDNEINTTQKLLAEIKNEPLPDVSYYQKLPEDLNIIVQKTSEVDKETSEVDTSVVQKTSHLNRRADAEIDNSIVSETSKVNQETFEVNTLATNTLSLYSASVVNTLSVGFLSFENDRILSLSWELKLSALEKISFFDGQVVIAKDGTITTQGQVIAKGGVKTNEISPISEGEDLTIKLKAKSEKRKATSYQLPATNDKETFEVNTSASNQKLKIENQLGEEVASIDASGSAYFRELVLDKYLEATSPAAIIAAEANFEQTGQFAPAIKTSGEIAGIGRLPAGEREIIIYNEKASPTSLILVTPTTPGFDGSLTVVEKAQGFFRVVTSKVQDKDITFDWLIIN